MVGAINVQENEVNGYLALPASQAGKAVLLLHSWWGLNAFFVEVSERFAEQGFVTFALDYYGGQTARTIDEANSLRTQLDRKTVNRLVTQSVDYLVMQPCTQGSKIGVIGYSLGAGFAVEAARSRDQVVRAVVVFYGTGGGKIDKTRAAFQGHFAEDDTWGAGPSKVEAFKGRIITAGRNADFYTYPGTKHWFFEADCPEYDLGAAELAWERTTQFLEQHTG